MQYTVFECFGHVWRMLAASLLAFTATGSRFLLYDQNPEIIMPDSIADVGRSHFQVDAVVGRCRWFSELENYLGNVSMGYAVALSNDGTSPVQVNLERIGWGAGLAGGEPFAAAFNSPISNSSFIIAPGSYAWLFRNDSSAVGNTTIMSMVADFTVNATVRATSVLYIDFTAFSLPALTPLPYVTRTDPGPDHEARVYKGIGMTSEVSTLPLQWSINDSVAGNTTLPVAYPLYNASTRMYNDLPTVAQGWTSNANPLADPSAVGSDMVGSWLWIPGWGALDPWGCCDAGGQGSIANQANWGIVYHIRGFVTNTGVQERRLSFTLRNTGCMAPVAYSSRLSSPWLSHVLWNPGDELALATLPLPAGQTTIFHVRWVLGGPSCGSEYNYFTLV